MKHHMRVVWAAFALLVAAFIALPAALSQTGPSLVYKGTDDQGQKVSLRIYQTPCRNDQVLAYLVRGVRPDFVAQFKAAALHWKGKDWASCWIEYQGVVYSFDEEGSQLQPIPATAFRDESI